MIKTIGTGIIAVEQIQRLELDFNEGEAVEPFIFNPFQKNPVEVTRLAIKFTNIPNDVSKINIGAKYEKNESGGGTDFTDHVRIGFILPVSDTPVVSPGKKRLKRKNLLKFRGSEGHVDLRSWAEGKRASLTFDMTKSDVTELEVFLEVSWEDPDPHTKNSTRYQESDRPVIQLALSATKESKRGGFDRKVPLKFSTDGSKIDSQEQFIDMADVFDAYKTEGIGYSLHQKQILTSLIVRELINKQFADRSDLVVNYIGTDTWENLFSTVRSLKHNKIWEKISSFVCWFHPDWDKKAIDRYDFLGELGDHDKIIRKSILNSGEDIPLADITICTYVVPWALNSDSGAEDYNEKSSESGFMDLLNSSLKEGGYLVVVDPKQDTYVRSRPVPTAFNLEAKLSPANGWTMDKKIKTYFDSDKIPELKSSKYDLFKKRSKFPGMHVNPHSDEGAEKPVSDNFLTGNQQIERRDIHSIQEIYAECLTSELNFTSCAGRLARIDEMFHPNLEFFKTENEIWSGGERSNSVSLEESLRSLPKTSGETSDFFLNILTAEAGMGKTTAFRNLARLKFEAFGNQLGGLIPEKNGSPAILPIFVSAKSLEAYIDLASLAFNPNHANDIFDYSLPYGGIWQGIFEELDRSTSAQKLRLRANHQHQSEVDLGKSPPRGSPETSDHEEADAGDEWDRTMRALAASLSKCYLDKAGYNGMSDLMVSQDDLGNYLIELHKKLTLNPPIVPEVAQRVESLFEFEVGKHSLYFHSELLSCALASSLLDTFDVLRGGMTHSELMSMVQHNITQGGTCIFIDALDEADNPEKVIGFVERVGLFDSVISKTLVDPRHSIASLINHSPPQSDIKKTQHGAEIRTHYKISEVYLSTRPETKFTHED